MGIGHTKAPTPVPTPSESDRYLGIAFKKETDSKFKQHDFLIYAVLVIVGATMILCVIATFTMYQSQANFNHDVYEENQTASGTYHQQLVDNQNKIVQLQNEVNSLRSGTGHSTN